MMIYLSPIITLVILIFLFSVLFFRKRKIAFMHNGLTYCIPLVLIMIIPYHQLERLLLNTMAGLWPVFFINTIITFIEISLLYIAITSLTRKEKIIDLNLFPIYLLIGLGMGSGHFLRDVLLVWYHPLSGYFGYSQFSSFITSFYLAQEVFQALLFVVSAGFIGLGCIRMAKGQSLLGITSLIYAFLIIEIDSIIRVLFQYVPSFSFFASVYVISLLPLLLILGSAFLWYSYRRQERRESELKKDDSETSPTS